MDSALAREALEKAGLAAGNARDAQTRVEAALKLVQEILARLTAAGTLDLAALEELERRLAVAEAQMDEAEILTKMEEFRRHRTLQDRMVSSADMAASRTPQLGFRCKLQSRLPSITPAICARILIPFYEGILYVSVFISTDNRHNCPERK